MRSILDRSNRLIDGPLDTAPRLLLLVAALLLVPTYFLPLWKLTMFAPQYPAGLKLDIYSYKLQGGNSGQDISEINILNHYIGMKDLTTADFTEFKWMPFVIGMLSLLFLRALVRGRMGDLIDVLMLYVYFGLFSLGSFAYKLYSYGHNLGPTASVKVDPFMPPLFGHKKLANFEVYSFPATGAYALTAVLLVLLMALFLSWRDARREEREEVRSVG